jgi:signal transduction histidine kinase
MLAPRVLLAGEEREAMAAAGPAQGIGARAPRAAVLWGIALAGVVAAAVSVALAVTSDHITEAAVRATLMVWVILGYAIAGVIARWRRPESRFGPLLIAGSVIFFLGSLSWANAALPYTVGILVDLLPAAFFLHVYLAFPSGRLRSRFERVLVGAAYFTAFGLQIVGLALGGFGPDNVIALVSEPETSYDLLRFQLVVLSACSLTGIGVLAVRRRGAGRPLRRSLALLIDSFALALLMVAVLFMSAALGLIEGQLAFEVLRNAMYFVFGLAPIVFLVGLLEARLARSAIGDLFLELQANPAPADLRAAFARALRDPSLRLVFWLPEYENWADLDGRPVELGDLAAGRAITLIDRQDAHVAALLHDPALEDEPELLEAVVAAAAIALENAQLQAELQARLDELKGSRSRIVEAGDTERRRLERNLHDGAQQRLVALSLNLRAVSTRLAPDSDEEQLLTTARQELAASLKELRELAQGIHPAVLTDYGLGVALESLAARAPVPVDLTVGIDGRLPTQVEVAAYYLVSEGLANIAKYSEAASATIDVERENGHLVVEVADDGVGGADPTGGSGLRGLADRIEALGGRLRVWSAPAQGTKVRAEIPCE